MTEFTAGNYRKEPLWRHKNQLLWSRIPANLNDWLFDQSSLTRRLQRWCVGTFRVQVFHQSFQRPLRSEALRLDMDHRQYALVRQVHLYCGDQAVVFARTIIPPQSLVGRQKRLASLGQRSLGAVLFADKTMQRSRIEVARITEKHMLHADALRYSQNRQSIWGRRSVFTLRGYPLLVSEFYLPPVLANKDRGP